MKWAAMKTLAGLRLLTAQRVLRRPEFALLSLLALLSPTFGCGAAANRRLQVPPFLVPALGAGPKVGWQSAPGQPSVVNFFASWCSACVTELPLLATAAGRNGQVHFVGVDVNDGDGIAASRLLRRYGVAYRIGLDPSGDIALRYRLPGLPDTLFVGADGTIHKWVIGQLSPASLADGLRRLGLASRS